jgi:hypothetical protein
MLSMATAAKPIGPIEGGRKVVSKLKKLLPADTRWWIEYFEEDGVYLLELYADGLEASKIYDEAGPLLYELSQRGLSIAIVPSDRKRLERHPELETLAV